MTPAELAWKRLLAKSAWSNVDLYKWRSRMFPASVEDAAGALGLKRRAYSYMEGGTTSTGRLRPLVPKAIVLAAKELARRREEVVDGVKARLGEAVPIEITARVAVEDFDVA